MNVFKILGLICSVLGLFTTLLGWVDINGDQNIGLVTFAGFVSFPLYIFCIAIYYKSFGRNDKSLYYYILTLYTIIIINTVVNYFDTEYSKGYEQILIGFDINICLLFLNIIFAVILIILDNPESENKYDIIKFQKILKIIGFILALIYIFIAFLYLKKLHDSTTSENNNVQNNQISNQTNFVETKEGQIQFEGINKIKVIYNGELKNNSNSIYKSVYLSLKIEFELENGNILTETDFNSENLLFPNIGNTVYNWKPNYNSEIKDLTSHYIPIDLESYPIKKVNAIIKIKAENLIDRLNEEYIIVKDVTNQWNEFIGKSTSVNNDNKLDLSKDVFNSESAIIKELKVVQNELYIVVDIVSIKDTPNEKYDYEIVNTNPKLRTYKVKSNVITTNSKCKISNDINYLMNNRTSVLNESPFGFAIISTNNFGELTEINLGCWN